MKRKQKPLINVYSVFLRLPVAAFILLLISCNKPAAEESFEKLKILQGSWGTSEGPDFRETWVLNADTLLMGIGLSMFNNDTVFSESMRIWFDQRQLHYAVMIEGNSDQVVFTQDKPLPGYHWKFTNPDHDYPNVIEYKLLNDSTLQARTTNLRGKQEQLFLFKRSGE